MKWMPKASNRQIRWERNMPKSGSQKTEDDDIAFVNITCPLYLDSCAIRLNNIGLRKCCYAIDTTRRKFNISILNVTRNEFTDNHNMMPREPS